MKVKPLAFKEKIKKRKAKITYSETTPYINQGKGDTLAVTFECCRARRKVPAPNHQRRVTDLQAEAYNTIYWEKPRPHQDSKGDTNGNYQLNFNTRC